MKTSLALSLAAATFLLASTSNAAVVKYKATLNGAQETPAVNTTSQGTADLDFDDAASTLTGSIEVTLADGAEITAAHIHLAECGKSGSIYKGLTVNTAGFNGTIAIDPPITLDADGVKALNEGRLYVNVHTKTNSGGEIRGQIYKADSTETCPPTAGADGGATDGGGSSSGGSSSGATTVPADGGATATPAASEDDGGCSTTGGASMSNGLVLAAGLGIAIGAVARRRKK